MVVSDVNLDLLNERRINGTVIPLNDLIRDAYDRVIHYSDRRSGDTRTQPRELAPAVRME
jgi:hypothetical protein